MRRKSIIAVFAGALVALVAASPAHASYTEHTPAPAPGGISETFTISTKVATNPYAPDPRGVSGPYQCQLLYHQYIATPGCGGFEIKVVLHGVTAQPTWPENTTDGGYLTAKADSERTFGCTRADGTFDWSTAFVVAQVQAAVPGVWVLDSLSYQWSLLRQTGGPDLHTAFYVNFPPVDYTCPAGAAKTQFGIKVSNVSVSATASKVLGTTTWSHPGPFYG